MTADGIGGSSTGWLQFARVPSAGLWWPPQVRHAEQTITIDGWMEFEAPPRVAVLFRQLRAELDKLLLAKIAAPTAEAELTSRTVGAIVQLLQEEEGFYVAQGAPSS